MSARAGIRRIKAVAGIALTWGVGWFTLGFAWSGLQLWGAESIALILGLATAVGAAGIVGGTGFAIALSLMARRRTMSQLTYVRVTIAGAVGGMLVWAPLAAVAPGAFGTVGSVAALLGAISSVVTLGVARNGSAADAFLAKPGRAALSSEIGLT